MATAQHINVSNGVPPIPSTATGVHTNEAGQRPAPQAPAAPAAPAAPQVPEGFQLPPTPQGFVPATQVQPGAIPPVPAQPAQPAQPAAPAVAPTYANFDTTTIEDPGLRAAADLFKSVGAAKGLDIDRAIGRAIDSGNVADIDLVYLAQTGGQDAQNLIQMAQSLVTQAGAYQERTVSNLHAAAGGKANFDAAVAVFNQSAPPATKHAVKALLDSGNPTNIQNAGQMLIDFARQSGALVQPGQGFQNPAAAQPSQQVVGTTPGQFKEALAELNQKYANRRDSEAYLTARNELYRARQIGYDAGLR
ncbi:hypothetical protein Axy09_034 [Achromobacter phage vB_AxyP_19-32_Axy09]|uniref:Scaffolding protein n=1 Tax=Achromobacter phage vB_AxyP_19-32_Axy09 TaxID=2591040 RepID=A0A514CTS8_9CAUD|nr:hypothetical protein Axy09_034 [Achromobacter phage vB_AxyP_19-32_Axy09]